MYGQQRWTVPAPLSRKLVSTTVCKIGTEILHCLFPAAIVSAVHSGITVTRVHSCSDLSVQSSDIQNTVINMKNFKIQQNSVPGSLHRCRRTDSLVDYGARRQKYAVLDGSG